MHFFIFFLQRCPSLPPSSHSSLLPSTPSHLPPTLLPFLSASLPPSLPISLLPSPTTLSGPLQHASHFISFTSCSGSCQPLMVMAGKRGSEGSWGWGWRGMSPPEHAVYMCYNISRKVISENKLCRSLESVFSFRDFMVNFVTCLNTYVWFYPSAVRVQKTRKEEKNRKLALCAIPFKTEKSHQHASLVSVFILVRWLIGCRALGHCITSFCILYNEFH